MQTNQLDESSQNQKILVKNIDEYNSVPNRTRYWFICKSCGKEHSVIKYNCKRERDRQVQLKCSKCLQAETNIKKYGVPNVFQSDIVKEKIRSTINEHYGVDNPSQSKAIQEKIKQNSVLKYGTEHWLQNDEILNKQFETNIKRHGVKYSAQVPGALQKRIETTREKYGVDCITQSEHFKDKSSVTNLTKYGVEHALQSDALKSKARQTCIQKYGVPSFSQTEIFQMKRYHRYAFNNEYFDSSWELAFYVYHVRMSHHIVREPKHFKYVFDNKERLYFPDFEVEGNYYEIKGDQFFKEDGSMCNPFDHSLDMLFEAKHLCGINNNVIFLRGSDMRLYIDFMKAEFGRNWKSKFKVS